MTETKTSLKEDKENWKQEFLIADKHRQRLERELKKMRKINQQQMAFFQDAAAFIRGGKWSDEVALATLIHDINGIATDQPCFLPRVTGYAQRERENT